MSINSLYTSNLRSQLRYLDVHEGRGKHARMNSPSPLLHKRLHRYGEPYYCPNKDCALLGWLAWVNADGVRYQSLYLRSMRS